MEPTDKKQRTINNNSGQRNHKQFGKWLCMVVAGLFLLFIARFAYIAVIKDVKNHDLAAAAQQRYTQSRIIPAQRGNIYDADGNVLARDTSKYTVYAVLDKNEKSVKGKPLYVTNKKRTARILAHYLDMPEKKVYKILTPKKKLYQVQFGTAGSNISVSKMEEIKAQKLPGINFIKTPAHIGHGGRAFAQRRRVEPVLVVAAYVKPFGICHFHLRFLSLYARRAVRVKKLHPRRGLGKNRCTA